MNRNLSFAGILALCLILTSCASIVSKSEWPLTVSTQPSGAKITITNKKGATVYSGTSPATVVLDASSGYFKRESYKVIIEMDGYERREIPVTCKVNSWYWGNILLGGLVGMLIVDPATGAMYKLRTSSIHETLTLTTGALQPETHLNICRVSDLPEEVQAQLERVDMSQE